jgi:thiol:disulfide interchange protein DsbG
VKINRAWGAALAALVVWGSAVGHAMAAAPSEGASGASARAATVSVASVALPAGVVKPGFFDAHGIQVLKWQRGVGGLNVWQVEHNGMQTVFYSTPDNKTLISGVLWDAATGAVQSDAYITAEMTSPQNIARINGAGAIAEAVDAEQSGAQLGTQAAGGSAAAQVALAGTGRLGAVTESIGGVASLTGIKEGRAPVSKTIYIVFDPRCPHCRSVYDQSREFIAHGGSIKWLPTTVLGNPGDGLNRVAAILQAPDPVKALNLVEHSAVLGQYDVKPATIKAVAANEAYFWAAFDRNPGAGTPGVPVAFFQDHTGAPQMVGNVDDPDLLKRIFGEMGK